MSLQSLMEEQERQKAQLDSDAKRARELAEAAIQPPIGTQWRTVAPQDILAAAQVYATLATRRY